VSAYRPSVPDPLTFPLGQWQAGSAPLLDAEVEVDPRLFAWLVNKAAARATGIYEVGLGKPRLKVAVTF